jgi:hypothetical protein
MCEFISFGGKRNEPKKNHPLQCWPSAALCASAYTGAAELAIAQTVLALVRSKPPVLDNPKGDKNQNRWCQGYYRDTYPYKYFPPELTAFSQNQKLKRLFKKTNIHGNR